MKLLEPIYCPISLKRITSKFSFANVSISDINDDSNVISISDNQSYQIKNVCLENKHPAEVCMHRLLGSLDLHEDTMFMRDNKFSRAYCYIHKISWNTAASKTIDGYFEPIFFNGTKLNQNLRLQPGNLFRFDPKKLHGIMSNCKIDMFVFWF